MVAARWSGAVMACRRTPRHPLLQFRSAFCCPVWLLPLRDVLSVAVMLASYGGRQVVWRGHGLQADTPPSSVTVPICILLPGLAFAAARRLVGGGDAGQLWWPPGGLARSWLAGGHPAILCYSSDLHSVARSGFCRCETSCRWR